MFVKFSVFICFQALFIQGFSAQCFGAYNGLAAEGWPAINPSGWEGTMGCAGGNALAWDAATPFRTAPPCAGSAMAAASAYPADSWAAAPFAPMGWGAGYSPASLAASNGGGLAITSASPIAPTGVSMNSENIYEGLLAVSGAMPFLGAVALEGALPTGGAGAVSYGCGNGNVAMINEDYAAGYGVGALGYGAGISGPAYGYNGLASPVAIEAGLAGPAFGYNGIAGARTGSCGCGAAF